MSQSTILITGTKAGIGKGLLTAYAARPQTTVIAAIRDSPDSEPARTLQAIPVGKGSKIIVAQYDAASFDSPFKLVSTLESEHKITSLDIVIANAGILKHFGPAISTKPELLEEHFRVNTIGPILLYQATAPLLKKSSKNPRYAIISSSIGSNTLQDYFNMPMLAYGMSKAAVNWAASRISREEKEIAVVPLQPGWVQTEMGERAATWNGMQKTDIPLTLDQSVNGLVKVIDSLTLEASSGKFFDQDGQEVAW